VIRYRKARTVSQRKLSEPERTCNTGFVVRCSSMQSRHQDTRRSICLVPTKPQFLSRQSFVTVPELPTEAFSRSLFQRHSSRYLEPSSFSPGINVQEDIDATTSFPCPSHWEIPSQAVSEYLDIRTGWTADFNHLWQSSLPIRRSHCAFTALIASSSDEGH
jgi:hypothetical protein